jgi:HEAT repeat protein
VGFPAWSIARALVDIGDTSVLPALFPLIKEGSVNTRFALAGVFPQIVSEEDRALVPQLIEALDHRPMRVEALIEALGKIGDPTAVPAIVRFMGECLGMDSSSALRVRNVAAEALARLGPAGMQALRDGLGHGDARIRETAVLGLAFGGDLEDQERLQVVAEGDEDSRVRFRASVAIRRIREAREEGESSE